MLSDLFTNLAVTLILGAILGAVAQRVVDVGWNRTARSFRIFSRRKRARQETQIEEETRITTLAPFVPPIDWSDNRENIRATIRPQSFFLSPPQDLQSGLDTNQFPHTEDVLPDTFHDFFQDYPEALEVLEEARLEVAQHFADGTEGAHFNGRKYGVRRTRPHERTADVAELPKLRPVAPRVLPIPKARPGGTSR